MQPRVVGGPGEEDDRQVQRPALAARPGGVGHRPVAGRRVGGPEEVVMRRGQQHPRERQVGRGVARGDVAEVDHRADPAVTDQDVGRVRVAVQPHGRTVPAGSRQRGRPGGQHRVAVDLPGHGLQVLLEVGRALRERHPAVRVDRGVRRRRHVQRPEEAAEVRRRPRRVERRPVRGGRPRQERRDAPRPRVPLPRHPGAHRHGHRQREPGGEGREPALLVDDDGRAQGAPRQPGHQLVSQPEQRVVPPVGQRRDGQPGQAGVLRGEQPAHQVRGDLKLCRWHGVGHKPTVSDAQP